MNSDVLQVQQSLGIVGRSPRLQQAIAAAIQAAPYDVNVLIVGENGVGKEVFHKILHNYSNRRFKKRIPVNCGALPEGTINSELFGHVKGAYTGALADRKGFFEEADGGTIFLDEVGELPLDTQARLLRILETGEYQRMGSNEIRKTDVRVVAATNKDLRQAIERGTFREDLYYRLATVTIHVPPLRERPEDIHLLFRKFASDIANQYRIPGISVDDSGRQLLLAYRWPGNVRQLLHLVEEISIVEEERVITADILKRYLPDFESRVSLGGQGQPSGDEFLPGEKAALYQLILGMRQQLEEVRQHLGLSKRNTSAPTSNSRALGPASPIITPSSQSVVSQQDDDFEEQEAVEVEDISNVPARETSNGGHPIKIQTLEEMEKEAIAAALVRHGGNKRKAAEELGISERTIHRKIADYGL
ncbi:MAG: sigma-54-dependent Fis family transcriptional regulator [Bacteroidales bacterium]|nr:sigma-54-dependent Fis family transcriptional regulator [Bacteroidales bacterium]